MFRTNSVSNIMKVWDCPKYVECREKHALQATYTVWSKKTDPLVYFHDNFGKYGPI